MSIHEALQLLERLEEGMKDPQFEAALNDRRLNVSFALLGALALQDYLRGDVTAALESFTTLAEDLKARVDLSRMDI